MGSWRIWKARELRMNGQFLVPSTELLLAGDAPKVDGVWAEPGQVGSPLPSPGCSRTGTPGTVHRQP